MFIPFSDIKIDSHSSFRIEYKLIIFFLFPEPYSVVLLWVGALLYSIGSSLYSCQRLNPSIVGCLRYIRLEAGSGRDGGGGVGGQMACVVGRRKTWREGGCDGGGGGRVGNRCWKDVKQMESRRRGRNVCVCVAVGRRGERRKEEHVRTPQ